MNIALQNINSHNRIGKQDCPIAESQRGIKPYRIEADLNRTSNITVASQFKQLNDQCLSNKYPPICINGRSRLKEDVVALGFDIVSTAPQ
jgi:hypothetical protein